jgi:hypothetical protein
MRATAATFGVLWLVAMLGGCGIGYNTALFMTKSNIGIDADTKPPTLELSIARREGVIAPGFEGGQTPPVIASFRTHSNPFARFFFGVESTFAGGDAAVALARPPGQNGVDHESVLCLTRALEDRAVLGIDVSIAKPGHVAPFTFATDTTLGLKIAWSGTAGQFPDTVRLGFNRKEFALAPVMGSDQVKCKLFGTEVDGRYAVWIPPFVAVLNNDVELGAPTETGVKWVQYFATGKAATALANRDEIRHVIMQRLEPAAFTGGWDPDAKCLDAWLAKSPDNVRDLSRWWNEHGLPGVGVLAVKSKERKKERDAFIEQRGITCD